MVFLVKMEYYGPIKKYRMTISAHFLWHQAKHAQELIYKTIYAMLRKLKEYMYMYPFTT
jgi:hypothetical protein